MASPDSPADSRTKKAQIIEADLTWTGRGFAPGIRVAVGTDGLIEAVGELGQSPTQRLRDRALLPGFVNVHSHAFQRGLRGHGETFPEGAGSFWTWRQAMYDLVSSLDVPRMHSLSRQAFDEMLDAGITTVGEFHYLHHDQRGEGYAMDEVVLRAAKDAGIRIVLLESYYRTGGIGKELEGGQLRFRTRSLEEFWAQVDRLTGMIEPATQSLGVAPHSVRAASMEDIATIYAEALKRHMVCHMHVEEQPLEIEECLAALHQTPMALVNERLPVGPRFTAVHCTHTAAADLEAFIHAGGNICLCPLTEANLGDGIPDVRRIDRNSGRICIGTDSNARLCFAEEMRWLEYGQRLLTRSRGVHTDAEGVVARKLLEEATIAGARALGLRTGAIQQGHAADFIALDLQTPSLRGWTNQTLLESFTFGSANDAIAATCVGGRWRDTSLRR